MTITQISHRDKVLVDSDGLIATYVNTDSSHKQASRIFSELISRKAELYCLNLVIQEVATVLSHKHGQDMAIDFMRRFSKLPITVVDLDARLEALAWEVFGEQSKKGTSFVDCANLAWVKSRKAKAIFSFDKFYPKMIILEVE